MRRTRDGRPWFLYFAGNAAAGNKTSWVRAGPFPSGSAVWFSAVALGCCPTTAESLPADAPPAVRAHAGGRHVHAQWDCVPSESVQLRLHTWNTTRTEAAKPRLDADVPTAGRTPLVDAFLAFRGVTIPTTALV